MSVTRNRRRAYHAIHHYRFVKAKRRRGPIRGNPQPNRRVVCAGCKRERHTTSTWPFCKRCRKKMEEAA